MGLKLKKASRAPLLQWDRSTDGKDEWSTHYKGWKLTIHQDSDGDWVWNAEDWNTEYDIHHVTGTRRERWQAEGTAAAWAEAVPR